ncbi:hypothetical protein J7E99_31140 [Streptomyces sp. ISL-44]|uniref:hypothetical protein n=1 Tax=Streptomyces sp. ISL-44 TaxID=2819184 RepID=UPI001BEA0CA4|nr:hypothetical protein [Streptomyces sp. ISL-44]MBT2545036.1 hypothetical protein [Streptomyces sp. ISL-44]
MPPAAHAHGDSVKVVITGQRDGHLTTDIRWENDGDAIEEAVAATVNATSADGTRTVGPWKLVRDSGTRTSWNTAEVLPAGTWTVHVHVGFPSLGHAEHEVSVPVVDPAPPTSSAGPDSSPPASPAATAVPSAAASAQSPSPAAVSESASPAPVGDSSTISWTTAGIAVTALAGAAAGTLLVRRARARAQARDDG